MSSNNKQDYSSVLNPVAHILTEETLENTEQNIKIQEIADSTTTSITLNTEHPESKFKITFKQKIKTPTKTIQATNLLKATPYTIKNKKSNQLTLTKEQVIAQTTETTLQTTTSKIKKIKTRSKLHPIIDQLAVKDLIAELQEEIQTTDAPQTQITKEKTQIEENEPELITLEDLEAQVELEEINKEPEEDLITLNTIIINKKQETEPTKLTRKELRKAKKQEKRTQKEQRKTEKQQNSLSFSLQIGWARTLASFVLLSFVVVLPIHAVSITNNTAKSKGEITSMSMSALGSIETATSAAMEKNFTKATTSFKQAAVSLKNAEQELTSANKSLLGIADLLPNTRGQIKQAKLLLQSGQHLANAASTMSDGMDTVANRTTKSPATAVALFSVFAEEALPELKEANTALTKVDLSSIPVNQRKTIRDIRTASKTIEYSLQDFLTNSTAIQNILGDKKRQRYLVLFQNNTELRPTGGFWGSFAEVDILDGEILKVTIPGGGTYDMQGQLTNKVKAPEPLQLVKARWELQDANWFPDFPTTAKKAMWFYEQSGGPSVDGVIAINATLVADLIAKTGPIELPNYNITLDSENFLFKTQKQVELDYDKEKNQPKGMIGELAPILLKKIMETKGENFLQITNTFSEGLAKKDIQIYHQDPEIQAAVHQLGWDGRILGNTGDYLMVVHTNIGGGKTDGIIDDEISVDSSIRGDGRIENIVKITRTHHGLKSSTFSGENNVSFTRIFVPRGSELLSVQGAKAPDQSLFESTAGLQTDQDLQRIENTRIDEGSGATISESLGKTSFGHWLQTKPGTESTLTFRYLLPADILDEPKDSIINKAAKAIGIPQTTRHSILIQKQPGVAYRETNYTFNPGTRYTSMWSTSETLKNMTWENNEDGFFGMILEKK